MRFLLALIFIFTSCAQTPKRMEDMQTYFEENANELNLRQSFAFYHGNESYYFAARDIKDGQYSCHFFIGFKNEKLSYSFPAYRFKELDSIYEKNISLEEKKTLALNKINDFDFVSQKCTKEIALHKTDPLEDALTFLVFAPFIPLALVFGAETWINSTKETLLNAKMDHLRLGMTVEQVKEVLDEPLVERKTKHYTYHQVDNQHYRLVMFFKDGKLNAMARGFRDRNKP